MSSGDGLSGDDESLLMSDLCSSKEIPGITLTLAVQFENRADGYTMYTRGDGTPYGTPYQNNQTIPTMYLLGGNGKHRYNNIVI